MDTNADFSEQVLEIPPDQLLQPDFIDQQVKDFVPRTDVEDSHEAIKDKALATEVEKVIVEQSNNHPATDQITRTDTVPVLSGSQEPIRSANDFYDWQTQHADKWSFQVVGAANRNQLESFVNQHNLQQRNYAIAKTQVNEADWWIVLVGLFNSRDEALSQRNQLPSELASQAWVRQVKTITAEAD